MCITFNLLAVLSSKIKKKLKNKIKKTSRNLEAFCHVEKIFNWFIRSLKIPIISACFTNHFVNWLRSSLDEFREAPAALRIVED